MGQVFSWSPGVPGRSTSVPPRHFSAGATAVMPASSRITRRSSSSRSASASSGIGGPVLSRSETMGNGSRAGAEEETRVDVGAAARPLVAAGTGAASGPAPLGAAADAGSAAEIVLAVAIAAVDADRPAITIGGDDGVHAVGLADPAEIFDRLPGAIAAWLHGGCMIAPTRETHNEP